MGSRDLLKRWSSAPNQTRAGRALEGCLEPVNWWAILYNGWAHWLGVIMRRFMWLSVVLLGMGMSQPADAAKVFVTQYESQAKYTAFQVKYESQAKLKVFFVKYESQADCLL